MLAQLVCLDRRYQRMNCFNIRQIQALLRAKHFNDLVNSHEHNQFMRKTMIGLRFKTNNRDLINTNMLMFYRNGIHSTTDPKNQSFSYSVLVSESGYDFINIDSAD